MLVLGVDIGTSSLKVGAVAVEDGAYLGGAEARYELVHPRPGWSELPAQRYVDAFHEVLATLGEQVDLERVKALCISSQGQTFVPVDSSGQCLQNAWTWIDGRAEVQARELAEQFDRETLFQQVGLDGVSAGSFASMVKHVRDRHPEVYSRTWKLLHVSSFLIYHLTGQTVWDANTASIGAVYDWQDRTWYSDMLRATGVDVARLPQVVASGTVVGRVAADVGLPKGAAVVSGANDQTANAIGAGLDDDAKVLVVLGTALIGYKIYPAGGLPDTRGYHGLCSVYPMSPASSQLGYTNSGCGTFDWCKRLLADTAGYDEVFEHIRHVPIGSDGVTCLIDLDGRAWPENAQYRGLFAGLSRKTDRWAMLRSVVEGICFGTRELIELMNWDLHGKVVRVVGGATRSDVWVQMLADVLGVRLERLGHDQSGVVGSAIMAGVAAGLFADYPSAMQRVVTVAERFDPDPTRRAAYETVYRRFQTLRTSADAYYGTTS